MTSPKEQAVIEGLIDTDTIKRLLRAKKSEYISKTIKKNRLKEHEEEGWEVDKANVRTYRVKKAKPHSQFFEDRVWWLLAKLGFEYMNKDNNFKITHSKIPTISPKQIDVLAAERETVIIVECKSAVQRKRRDFQKDIAEIKDIKKGICNNIRKHFSSYGPGWKPKIAWIFATRNCIVSEPDLARMANGNIVHLTEGDIEYYEKLISLLGPVAKYQLFGKLFKGQDIPELDLIVPAIRGNAGKFKYYSFSIEPDSLLKISFILHRIDSSSEAFETYQRMVSKSRIRDIEKYIDDPEGKGTGFFPNSIIININSRRKLQFDLAKTAKHSSSSKLGILHLPKKYHSAFIIDGQHRLYGYGKSKWRSKHHVPVVAFENLPQDIQTKLFVDINHKQRSVPTNLLLTLMADFSWNSSNDDEAIEAVKIQLIKRLSSDLRSPLYKRIIVTQESKTSTCCLTLNYLRGQINKTNFFGMTEKKKLRKQGYFSEGSHKDTLQKTLDFLIGCFDFLQIKLPDQWDRGSAEGGFIAMNLGVSAIIRVIDDILEFLVNNKGLEPTKLTSEELSKKVQPYLKTVAAYVDSIGFEGTKKLRGYMGGGAVDKVLREFQNAINAEYEDFSPEGFVKWKEASSGKYNAETRCLLNDIQLKIREKVFEALKREYGVQGWWNNVPIKIQKECASRAIDVGRKEPDENFLLLLEYQEIIDKQSKVLIESFTRPEEEQSSKKNKLKWIGCINTIRNKIAHPEREPATEEDRDCVKDIHDWLCADEA